MGSQVQMRCLPPKGKPKPEVYWNKDGSRIEEGTEVRNSRYLLGQLLFFFFYHQGYLVTGDGHLIIVSARTSDVANYTCVAKNVAASRQSQPAQVTVYGKPNSLMGGNYLGAAISVIHTHMLPAREAN